MAHSLHLDENKIRANVAQFLNHHFGNDPENVCKAPEVLRKLELAKIEAENKLSGVNTDNPQGFGLLKHRCNQVLHQATNLLSQKDKILQEAQTCLNENKSMRAEFDTAVRKVKQVEKYAKYLQWVKWFDETSSKIKAAIERGNDHHAVSHYEDMALQCSSLSRSHCQSLLKFIEGTVTNWHLILTDRFEKCFEMVLGEIKWPFTFTTVTGGGAPFLPTLTKEHKTRFETFFTYLLRVRLPDELMTGVDSDKTSGPLLPPMPLLLKPLKKRFVYHFCGHRKTNSIRKPEWYFTQILTWINCHGPFLNRYAQPIVDSCGVNAVVEVEFMRGLVRLASDKLRKDIPALILDRDDISHVINETLMFDKDLRAFDYPPYPPSCLQVLTQEDCFSRWIQIEENFAGDNMDRMLSSPHAWDPQYSEKIEVDQLKIPECAESFLTMILTITERYKYLPDAGCRLRFLHLQLKLLDDFRIRLVQLTKEHEHDPIANGSNFCAILNSVNYVGIILTDWCDLPFFLQMQFYKVQFDSLVKEQQILKEKLTKAIADNKTCRLDDFPEDEVLVKSDLELFQLLRDVDEESLDLLDGTVFAEIIAELNTFKTKMMTTLARVVFTDVRAKSTPYRDEQWHSCPAPSEVIKPSLTASACPMLMVLKSSLNTLKRNLALPTFNKLWQLIAKDLNSFVYEEIIRRKRFSEGGARQFNFDITRNLFPIFSEHTQRPENFFKDVKEACILLTLLKGSSLLLVEALGTAKADPHKAAAVLEEFGIFKMTPKEVAAVLNLRTDLNIG